ncbi:hypothetical protein LX66_3906 [Chitinophaga japonensis]|uniref:Tetratricopeptide repeat protein n=1 Tax=Chitinophaga japonensis TaxID=104662 RepID=A0A562T057_CHIJA|nr:hypothetical protein LX66_3906 [Chitinophaga japonensis]
MLFTALLFMILAVQAQDTQLENAVALLDKAQTVKDYQDLSARFTQAGNAQQTNWLPYYYAALCNAKIGFLLQDDGERIEPFSNEGESNAKQARELLRAGGNKKDLAELYTVMSMIYRTRVFINPMTYGRKYGPTSQQYLDKALELDPDNPRALYVQAWVKYYTPKMWGGDKDKAKTLLESALQKLAAQKAGGVEPHWGKTESEALLAKTGSKQ